MPKIVIAGQWSMNHDRCVDCGKNDKRHVAHGLCVTCYDRFIRQRRGERRPRQPKAKAPKPAPKFPKLGAMCLIVPTNEIGQIVGYVRTYEEWTVRVEGEPDMPWEPCDLAPHAMPLRRAA